MKMPPTPPRPTVRTVTTTKIEKIVTLSWLQLDHVIREHLKMPADAIITFHLAPDRKLAEDVACQVLHSTVTESVA